MRRCYLLLASCYWLAGQLWAEPIYTYTATSASMGHFVGSDIVFDALGPGFSINGGVAIDNLPFFYVGQEIPLTISFPSVGTDNTGGTVDFGGIVTRDINVDGSIQELPNGSSSFVIPPNPNTTYTFAAHMTGQITARPIFCGPSAPSPAPPCGTAAVLLIDLPGELTVDLIHTGGASSPYYVHETFMNVPEPSGIGLWLLGVYTVGTILSARKRKARGRRLL